MARNKRTREQKAIAKGKPYGMTGERRQLNMRSTSSRIYENGRLPQEIKQQLEAPPAHYRFEGVVTDNHWSIADFPVIWPEIEKLHVAKAALEEARGDGALTKMQRSIIKHHRRKVEIIADYIDHQAMRSVKV